MKNNFPDFNRYISIMDRLMKMYYDHGLADYEIGWGQQFYVEYIYDHPGTSAQEMVEYIRVDKATLTKVVKKLVLPCTNSRVNSTRYPRPLHVCEARRRHRYAVASQTHR